MPVSKSIPSAGRASKFPIRQMTILAICRICEPIAFMSIFPYVYYMVEDFGIAKKESEISIYAGLLTSAFTIAEFSAGIPWGKVSDVIGRKPVILIGLAGTALSMMMFGLAPNFPVALLARALGGLLNGNMGVLQTTIAEMITDKSQQPRAYTIMPFVWCLGSILGPALGGALARPAISYPSIFTADSIWARFPYLLSNLICTIIIIFGVTIGILFFEETHRVKKYRRDPGLEAGKWIIKNISVWKSIPLPLTTKTTQNDNLSETTSLLHQNENTNHSCSSAEPSIENTNDNHTVSRVFTKQVITNIVCFGILAYHTMALDSMLPIFLSYPSPLNKSSWSMPFKFSIGYGLSTKEIGVILSFQGVYSMFANVLLFPILARRLGALSLFRVISISYPVLYFLIPYFSLLPPSLNYLGIYLIAVWKCTFSTLAYPSNAIMLANSAPSFLSLGIINGVAASTASLSRAFGPTISGFLTSIGQNTGYSGLAWWCCCLISLTGAVLCLYLRDEDNSPYLDEKIDSESVINVHEVCP
ncbi:putative major facilitator superfamily transporter [Erysiphe necator]|uniref:Putative major facilitator superfamily transporter n=1 Tax=Uncinula necator TaxID=52586 RepID=A0A0B1PCX0_UNCNE|nr:putative major facilitator superfamily transporter [Erysiphe necator]